MRRSLCTFAIVLGLSACSNPPGPASEGESSESKTRTVDVHDGSSPPKPSGDPDTRDEAASGGAIGETGGTQDVSAPPIGEPPTVEVLDAGAEPRQALRMNPKAGTVDRYTMSMRAHMLAGMLDTEPVRRDAPPLQVTIRVEVTQVDDTSVSADLKIEGLEVLPSEGVDPSLQQAAKDSTADLEERVVSIKYDTTNRRLVGITDEDLKGLNPQVRGSLLGLTAMLSRADAPLPSEPVGVGAKWKTVHMEKQQGVDLRNTTEYELRSREGARLVIVMRAVQDPLQDEFTPPGAPPDVTIQLKDFTSEIRGEIQLDLDHLAPARAQLKTQLKTTTEVMANSAPAAMTQTTRSEILLRDLERTPEG